MLFRSSIAEYKGKWYLFYHDTSISGQNHLRCVKIREIVYDGEGKMQLAEPQPKLQEVPPAKLED